MRIFIETPTFQKLAAKIWTDHEWLEFIDWISSNPLTGDVIPNADGARKVRWSVTGKGKRGGVRIIYFNVAEDGTVVLITLYQKSEQENISKKDIQKAV